MGYFFCDRSSGHPAAAEQSLAAFSAERYVTSDKVAYEQHDEQIHIGNDTHEHGRKRRYLS